MASIQLLQFQGPGTMNAGHTVTPPYWEPWIEQSYYMLLGTPVLFLQV